MEDEEELQQDTYTYCSVLRGREGERKRGREGGREERRKGEGGKREGGREEGREDRKEMRFSVFANTCSKHRARLPSACGITWTSY